LQNHFLFVLLLPQFPNDFVQGRIGKVEAVSGIDVIMVFEQTNSETVCILFPPLFCARMACDFACASLSSPLGADAQDEKFDHVHTP
jgi:hypothetical protein